MQAPRIYPERGLGRFSAVLFLNLPHRTDRHAALTQELSLAQIDPKRIHCISAVPTPLNGHIGCALSHIAALRTAQEAGWDNVLILEDDFAWTATPQIAHSVVEHFFLHFQEAWDVFFVATHVFSWLPTPHPHFFRILNSLCAHGYAVQRHYMPKLEQCFQEAYEALRQDSTYRIPQPQAIDRAWHPLQMLDRWYMADEPLGCQRASHSDIYHTVRDRAHPLPFHIS